MAGVGVLGPWGMRSIGKKHIATEMTGDESQLVKQFEAARRSCGSEGRLPTQEASRAGNLDEARRLNIERIAPLNEDVRESIGDLVQLPFSEARKVYRASVGLFETIRVVAMVALVLSIGLAAGVGPVLIRGITCSPRVVSSS